MTSRASCRHTGRWHQAAQGGFSMVEMAIALVVAGLMSWAAFSGYETVTAQQEIERGRAEAEQLQSIVRAFALRHGRLPCPDSDAVADGYENPPNGNCAAGNQVGWFPYVSMGLPMPTDKFLARYSVFRAANLADPGRDADLAVVTERTRDPDPAVPGNSSVPTYRDVTDLIAGLNNASNTAIVPFSAARTYLTGDAGVAGAIDCAANQVMAAAYWVIVPLQDRSGDGDRFDAPHTPGSACAASPSAPLRFGSDDVVVAESPGQLAGWLRRSLP